MTDTIIELVGPGRIPHHGSHYVDPVTNELVLLDDRGNCHSLYGPGEWLSATSVSTNPLP